MKKQILSVLLCTCIVFAALPNISTLAAGNVLYETKFSKIAVMNKSMADSESFFNSYVKRKGAFNNADKYGLDYNMKEKVRFVHDDGFNPAANDPVTERLMREGQLKLKAMATIRGDEHGGSEHRYSWTKRGAYQYMRVRGSDADNMRGPSDDRILAVGDESYEDVDYNSYAAADQQWLFWNVNYWSECGIDNCGSPKFSKPIAAFADRTGPKMTEYKVTLGDKYDSASYLPSASIPAEGIYIHFKFDEYIRFSDHSAAHDDVKLGLKLFNINTNQELQKSYDAKLYALRDDYITFRFVPDSGLNNHYIGSFGSITDGKNQNCLKSGTTGKGNFTNKVFCKDKDMSTMTDDWAKKALKDYGGTLLNSTSLFTDIAGNACQTTSPITMNKDGKLYIDKIAPAIEKVSVQFFDNEAAGTEDGVNRFVGPGRSAEINVTYSERVHFNTSGAKARLNIKDADGNPIEIEYKSHENIVIPNNPPDRTKITFQPLTVTADMVGAISGSGAGEAIRITEMVIGDLCDYRGNPTDGEAVIPSPDEQFYLDTLPPSVKAVKPSDSMGITPVDRFGTDGFVFEFTMEDSQSHGAENSSDVIANGSNILTGSILFDHMSDAQTDNFAYTYAISFDGNIPSEDKFVAGTCGKEFAFIQMSATETNPIRLYVKFPEEVLPNALEGASLSILCRDNAGNTTREKFLPDTNELRNMTDRSGPIISLQSFSTAYIDSTDTGNLNAKIRISDINGVDTVSVEYALPNKGAAPSDTDWQMMSVSGVSDTEFVGDITKSDISNNEGTQEFDLYVRAKDKANKSNQTVFGPRTMVYGKTYPHITIVADEAAMDSVPMVKIIGLGQSNGEETDPKYSNAYVLLRPDNNYYFDNGEFSDPDTYIMCERTRDGDHLFTPYSFGWEGDWSYGKLVSDNGRYTFAKIADSGSATEFASNIANYKYYGDVNIRFLIGYGIKAEDSGSISCASPIDDRSYTMHAVGMPAKTNDDDFDTKKKKYDIDFSVENRDALICSTDWSPNADKSTRKSIYDLAGTAINVSITPLAMPEWGLVGINFDKSFVSVIYWENNAEKELCRLSLSKNIQNRLVVPKGLSYPEGKQRYALKVVVTDAAEQGDWHQYESVEFIDFFNNDDANKGLFVDHCAISEFGLASYTGKVLLREGLPAIEETINQVGYDIDNASEQTYLNPERITLACHTDEDVLGHSHELAFTSRSTENDKEYIMVYNATDGLDAAAMEAKTKWKGIGASAADGKFAARFYDNTADIAALTEIDGEIPLIKGQDNLIVYYVMHDNGTVSKKRTMIIYADNDMAASELTLSPSESTVPTSAVYATVSGMEPESELYRHRKSVGSYELISGNEVLLDNEGESVFYVRDLSGNIAILTANPSFLYLKKPMLSGGSVRKYDKDSDSSAIGRDGMMGENGCVYEAQLEQNDCIEEYGFQLHIAFNEEYAARIGGGAVFHIPPMEKWDISASGLRKYEWNADIAQSSGIYYISIVDYDTSYSIKFKLIHKYDISKKDGEKEDIDLKVSVSDIAGNISDADLQATQMTNIKPEIKSIIQGGDLYPEAEGFYELSAIAVATVPIANVTPSVKTPKNGQGGFTAYANAGFWQRPSIGIYRDGDYQMTYTDIFGNQYEQTVHVAPFVNEDGYDCGLDILFSEPNPETGKVSMTVTALDERFPLDIVQGEYGTGLIFEEHSDKWDVLKRKVTTATVALDPNRSLLLCRYDPKEYIENNRFVYRSYPAMVVREFVKTTPQAEVVWYFDEFGTNELPKLVLEDVDEPKEPETTTKNVTAFLQSDRLINGINGKDITHTFTYGGETTYTFEFEDITGSKGSVTADLADIPIRILSPVTEPTDDTPPDYTMQVYAKYNGVLHSLNAYTNEDGVSNQSASPQEALTDISWTQGYLLNFELTDESAARLVIKNSGTGNGLTYSDASSDAIDGVSVSGTQISIDQPADFDVVIIDASNNILTIPFSKSDYQFDLEPPAIKAIDRIQTGLYEVTAYVLLEDNVSDSKDMTWIYPAGVRRVAGGEHDGKFAVVFSGNSSIEARFADQVGNTGHGEITVNSLNDTTPAVTEVIWTPSNGEDTTAPPMRKVNTDVTALVKFNTNIKDLTISCEDNSNPETCVSVLPQGDSARITFTDNNYENKSGKWKLKLNFTAPNHKSGSYELALDAMIDKTPPAVMVELTDEAASPYAEVKFTGMNEDFYLAESGSKLYLQNKVYTKKIDKKGVYTFKFTDAAGNRSEQTVEVENIDDAPPLILLGDLPADGQWFKDSVTFKATMNEAGSIICNGESYAIAAPTDRDGDGKFSEDECNWAKITVTDNGGYKITATDCAGISTETYLAVRCIDNTPPVMQFASTTVNIMQGTDPAYVKTLLADKAQITIWDDNTAPEEITVTADAFDESLLNRIGYHTVSYTAKDKAGNTGIGQRYLRIYSANEPQITLNGVKTFRDSVTILNSTDIKLSVSKLFGGDKEPYSVYLKQGRRTQGQMKLGSTLVKGSDFTVEKNRFYTLYIVTQSRGTYLTNLYVQ